MAPTIRKSGSRSAGSSAPVAPASPPSGPCRSSTPRLSSLANAPLSRVYPPAVAPQAPSAVRATALDLGMGHTSPGRPDRCQPLPISAHARNWGRPGAHSWGGSDMHARWLLLAATGAALLGTAALAGASQTAAQ